MNGDEAPYLYLTTIGRKTGLEREIEIWFVQVGECYYLLSGGFENSDWVKNILANASVSVRVGSKDAPPFAGLGRTVDDTLEPELALAVRERMKAKYQWGGGLVVELKPI